MTTEAFRRSLWLVPAFLAVHNLEEAAFASRWLAAHAGELSRWGLNVWPSAERLYVGLAAATVVPMGVTAFSLRAPERTWRVSLVFVMQAVVLLNAFVPHILGTVALGAYTPGVATAALVNVPFSVWVFRGARRLGWLSSREIAGIFLAGAVVLAGVMATLRAVLGG